MPAVVSAVLGRTGSADRISNRHPHALVATTVVVVDEQHAGLAQTAVRTLLPCVRKDRELLPPVSIRRTFGQLREHHVGVRSETDVRNAHVLTTEEVLDVRAGGEIAVRQNLRVLVRLSERQTVLR